MKFNPVVNEALTFLPKLSNKAQALRGEIARQRIARERDASFVTPLALWGGGCALSCHPGLTAHLPLVRSRVTRPSGGVCCPSVDLLLRRCAETTALPTLPSHLRGVLGFCSLMGRKYLVNLFYMSPAVEWLLWKKHWTITKHDLPTMPPPMSSSTQSQHIKYAPIP